MKFGKQLEEYQLPEWKGQYLPYSDLKKRLEEIASGEADEPPTPGIWRRTEITAVAGSPDNPTSPKGRPGPKGRRGSLSSWQKLEVTAGTARGNEFDDQAPGHAEAWRRVVEAEATRIGKAVSKGEQRLREQFNDLRSMAESAARKDAGGGSGEENQGVEGSGWDSDTGEDLNEVRFLEALTRVAEGVTRLRGFAELNHAALYKILKKHDKTLGSKEGLKVLLPRLIESTKLGDLERFDQLDDEVKQAFSKSSEEQGLHASPAVIRLAAGLGRGNLSNGAAQSGLDHGERMLYFFLGASLALFFAICLLIWLPLAEPQDSFSMSYFLSSFAVFRLVFCMILCLWSMGLVCHVCDSVNINHMFILDIDPRFSVGSSFFFSRAALLTSLWIFVFGLYVVDYKWMIMPTTDTGPNTRASWHFVLYPSALLGMTLVFMLWPSRICRGKYKLSLLRALGRTASAPLWIVSFGDNMIGDVLTSLTKPLQDVPAVVCYLGSHHPQDHSSIAEFTDHGDDCSSFVHLEVLPLISGAPFVFRLLQCARRYYDTKERKHLANFGKYLASLLVVVVTRIYVQPGWQIGVVSVFATIYAAYWDVVMDWGLGVSELRVMRSHFEPAVAWQRRVTSPSFDESVTFSRVATPEASSDFLCLKTPEADFIRMESHGAGAGFARLDSCGSAARVDTTRRHLHFRKRAYWLAMILDIIFRSSWVVTLMPVTLLSNDLIQRELLKTIVSSVEIFRRGMWAVLRIEYEQVANASGFRALLWVPTKLGCTKAETKKDKRKGATSRSDVRHKQKADTATTPLLETGFSAASTAAS